jgi:hypothetical protein
MRGRSLSEEKANKEPFSLSCRAAGKSSWYRIMLLAVLEMQIEIGVLADDLQEKKV